MQIISYIFFFFKETGINISSELSICMKCKILFSEKKTYITRLSFDEFTIIMVSVKRVSATLWRI